MKTPTGYVALRKGRNNVRNCIFIQWCDAEEHIKEYEDAEFSVIDTLQDAEKYIINNNTDVCSNIEKTVCTVTALDNQSPWLGHTGGQTNTNTAITATTTAPSPPPLPPATIDDIDIIDDNINACNNNDNNNTICLNNKSSCVENTEFQTDNLNLNNTTTITAAAPSPPPPPIPPAAIDDEIDNDNDDNNIIIGDTWKCNFNKLAMYRNPITGLYPKTIPDENLRKWLNIQRNEYRKKVRGIKSRLNDKRIELLRTIGIIFDTTNPPTNHRTAAANPLHTTTTTINNNKNNEIIIKNNTKAVIASLNLPKYDKIHKSWKNKFILYASYRKSDGTYPYPIIPKQDDIKYNLREWRQNQNKQYHKRMNNIKPNSMSNEKLELLRNIGFIFSYERKINKLLKLPTTTDSTTEQQQQEKPSQQQQEEEKENQLKGQNNTNIVEIQIDNNKHEEQRQQQQQQEEENQLKENKYSAKAVEAQICIEHEESKQQQQEENQSKENNNNKIVGPQYNNNEQIEQEENKGKKTKKRNKTDNRVKVKKDWKDKLTKLKQYMETHDGDWNVKREDDQKLRFWVLHQKAQYVRMKEGKKSKMNDEKLLLLQDIGVDFDKVVHSWPERIKQLKQFKEQNGHMNIPPDHPVLGKWAQKMIHQYKRMMAGKPVQGIESENIDELRTAGVFDFLNVVQPGSQQIFDEEFEVMIVQMKQYKDKHGISSIIPSNKKEYRDLYQWYRKIINEYRKLSDKESANKCRLSTIQIARLVEIGFKFIPPKKNRAIPFEERVEQLKEFKCNGGDVSKILRSHPQFGTFIRHQRLAYRLYCQGKPSSLNEEKVNKLNDLGIEWNVKKWVDPAVKNDKVLTWDERFQQLCDYKKKYGNTLVPTKNGRDYNGLGHWVKNQRRNYKLWNEGIKKTIQAMTAERALKLSNIGFAFDAKMHRGFQKKTKTNNNNETNNNMLYLSSLSSDNDTDDDDYDDHDNVEDEYNKYSA